MNLCETLKQNLIEALQKTLAQALEAKLESGEEFELELPDTETVVTFENGTLKGINGLKLKAYSAEFIADTLADVKDVYGI